MGTKVTLLVIVLSSLTLFIAWFISRYQQDREAASLIETDSAVYERFFSEDLARASSSWDAQSGQYVWGRTTEPHFAADLHDLNGVQQFFAMKEFLWLSVTSGPWLIGMAVLQFNYQSTLVMQLYRQADADGPAMSLKGRVDVPALTPFTPWGGKWVGNMNPSTGGHAVHFFPPPWHAAAAGVANITFLDDSIQVDVAGTLYDQTGAPTEVRLRADVTRSVHMMGMTFPLGPRRPSVVYKLAAAPLASPGMLLLRGGSQGGDQRFVVLPTGYAALDYTRGLLRRQTEWFWASFSSSSGVGVHLSSGTYDVDGVSMESTLYDGHTGGTVFIDEAVVFAKQDIITTPTGFTRHVWRITSPSISLTFTPYDGYDGKLNVGIVNVNLDHQWGTFTGTIQHSGNEVSIQDCPGVFEEHFAIW